MADLKELSAAIAAGKAPAVVGDALDALSMCIVAALNLYGLRRVVVTGLLSDLGEAARSRVSSMVTGSALWSRFENVSVAFASRQRARGLGLAAFQRLVLSGGAPPVEPDAGALD
jgi:predicted NBD/HSP70 family sugar kinase